MDKRRFQAIDCSVENCRYINRDKTMCERRGISVGRTDCEYTTCDSFENYDMRK
jgi:hypothetical protein